ncbi:hypothetical protein HG463_001100 [Candidatus Saccharibacteria bacterium]|nr:hypothetical protein [Candidatus Saccharibacteria bacterium]
MNTFKYILDQNRKNKMREKLGKASELIKSDNFLPKFRNRQKNYPDEWEKSVEIAKKKDNPEHYLAVVWAKNNIKKSLEWIRKLINIARNKLAILKARKAQKISQYSVDYEYNAKGRADYENMLGGLFNLK